MSDTLTLIDSSAFIEFSRAGGGGVADAVDSALAEGRAAVCSVVTCELLSGCRSRAEYRELELLFAGLEWLFVSQECWDRAAGLGYNLRRSGLTVPLTDRLVAVTARVHNASLLHCDTHFDMIGDIPDTLR